MEVNELSESKIRKILEAKLPRFLNHIISQTIFIFFRLSSDYLLEILSLLNNYRFG